MCCWRAKARRVVKGNISVVYEPYDAELGAAVIDAVGTPVFASRLLFAAQQHDSVAEVFAFSVSGHAPPQLLASSSDLDRSADRVEHYVRRFYREDPVRPSCGALTTQGGYAQRISAAEIKRSDYRAVCFDQPRLQEKLSFGWRSPSRSVVVNFYRRDVRRSANMASLTGLANVALSVLMGQASKTTAATVSLVDRLELHLARSFPRLTARERSVCARTQAGWSAVKIAEDLAISQSTVLTYRQRAYIRYGFSGMHGFLNAMIV
jgi:DNA-binding CsgD family transcriptional regulator